MNSYYSKIKRGMDMRNMLKKSVLMALSVATISTVMSTNVFADTTSSKYDGRFAEGKYIDNNGTLWSWGRNDYGQVGNGKTVNPELIPIKIMDNAASIEDTGETVYVIKKDGTLWSWGANGGMIGSGATGSIIQAVPVKALDNVVSAEVGSGTGYALKKDGTLCNIYGGEILSNVVAFKTSAKTTYALKEDGTLWAWGFNGLGQIGNGESSTQNVKTPVKVLEDVISINTTSGKFGYATAYAIKEDGTLWSWGYNNEGQVGNGSMRNQSTPVKILDDVVYVRASNFTAYAIKKDGTLWAWGANSSGQVGNDMTTTQTAPVKILDNVAIVEASNRFTAYAIKTDGTLWSWGANDMGQIGNGTRVEQTTPVKILSNVVAIEEDSDATPYAMKTDGTLWSWGANGSGEVGNGTTNEQLKPVQVLLKITKANQKIRVTLNGKEIKFDQEPILKGGSTLVPMRAIFEVMGADVKWNNSTRTVTGTNGDTVVKMTIDNPVMTVNGTSIKLNVAPTVLNGRTLVPTRAVAEAFNADVKWDSATQTVVITQ